MSKVIHGNAVDALLNNKIAMLCHVCNTKGKMGAGIAKEIANRFPEAYEADKIAHRRRENELGAVSYGSNLEGDFWVANMYAQTNYGKYGPFYRENGRQLNYGALSECLREVALKYIELDRYWLPLAFPYEMGCGLAGGDWSVVKDMIEHIVTDMLEVPVVYIKLAEENEDVPTVDVNNFLSYK